MNQWKYLKYCNKLLFFQEKSYKSFLKMSFRRFAEFYFFCHNLKNSKSMADQRWAKNWVSDVLCLIPNPRYLNFSFLFHFQEQIFRTCNSVEAIFSDNSLKTFLLCQKHHKEESRRRIGTLISMHWDGLGKENLK